MKSFLYLCLGQIVRHVVFLPGNNASFHTGICSDSFPSVSLALNDFEWADQNLSGDTTLKQISSIKKCLYWSNLNHTLSCDGEVDGSQHKMKVCAKTASGRSC